MRMEKPGQEEPISQIDRVFAETKPEDVFGCLPHCGPPKTLTEMDAGVLAEARRRYERDA